MQRFLTPFLVLALPATAAAQGFVESMSPPVIERGKTTRVTFSGHDLGPGLDVWHSLPGGALTAKPVESHSDRLTFDVTAGADAPVGVFGVRLATRDGLTNATLLHLEDLPVRGNVAAAKPVSIALPACVWGTFQEGTLDRYVITVAAGERVSFEAVSNRLGKDADPLLIIRDSAGRYVTERDNDPGLYFDFRFEHVFEKAGTYVVEVRDARFKASEHDHYVLRMGKFPVERVAVPAAVRDPDRLATTFFDVRKRPGDHGSTWLPIVPAEGPICVARDFDEGRDVALTQAIAGPTQLAFLLSPTRTNPFLPLDRLLTTGRLQATRAIVPGTLCGVLRKPGQRQAFSLKLEKGQRLVLRGEAKSLNSPAEPDVVLTDRTGREIRRGTESRDGNEVTLDFTATTAGDYGLVVRDALRDGSDSHAYRLTVRDRPFPPTLTAEVEGLTIPQGTYQPVPLLITRTGTTGTIKLSLLGGPSGLRITPDEIPESAAPVTCKIEAAGSAPLGAYAIQIVADCGGEKVLVRTRPLIDKKLHNVDLIPIGLREDQTRPPPALTDRFAVQVTPPSPFTFELPVQVVTLSRYQSAPVPVVTMRAPGFDGPIHFVATGGQLADKNEGRTRVYADFPEATSKLSNFSGVVVSKILSNVAKSRIDVTGTGTHQGRRVHLKRTFELDLITAFRFLPEQVKASLLPGESVTVTLAMTRARTFDGPMTLHLSPMQGLEFPETVTVPRGQTSIDVVVKAANDVSPRKQGWSVTAIADVGGFEEEVRGQPVEIEVKAKKAELPKKK